MPSKRKRIAFLPRKRVQDLISLIAKEESLSQSRVVGILVEEALYSRGLFAPQLSDSFDINKERNNKERVKEYERNEINELVSDEGITYKSTTNGHLMQLIAQENTNDNSYNELIKLLKDFLEYKKGKGL